MRHDPRTPTLPLHASTASIEGLELPARADERGAVGDRFRAVSDHMERVNGPRYAGTTTLSHEERLASWRPTEAEDHVVRVAVDGDRVLGASSIWLPLQESTDVLDLGLALDDGLAPEDRRAVAEALTEDAMRLAHDLGRPTVMAGSPAAATGAAMASTGFGGADPEDAEAAPLLARGFVLEQVYRVSVADIRELDLDARLAAARARTGDAYETIAWEGPTPAEHRAAMRGLHERMSVDAPVGGLDLEPETWSDERLAEFERSKTDGGRTMRTAVVRHRPTGELAGFTSLFVGAVLSDRGDDVARQHDTLVVAEHRGRAIGMLLKLANLVELRDHHPAHPRVSTWNAEENRHMLAVNEATGFVAVAHEGVWQLREAR